MTAIGISGFAQSGKTTVANHIEATWGIPRHHIAEPLRDMLRSLLLRFGYSTNYADRYLTGDLKEEVIPELGVTSRRAQITLGTEWGRELIHPDIWARLWQFEVDALYGSDAMNDSVRFPNEEAAIRGLGGFTILIRRAGTQPGAWKWGFLNPVARFLYRRFGLFWGVHDSERVDRLKPDIVIDNVGDVQDLLTKVDEQLAAIGLARP